MAEVKRKSRKRKSTKGKKKAKSRDLSIKVHESKPRKRVEPDEMYYAELQDIELKESIRYPGSEYLQLTFELLDHPANVDENGNLAKGITFRGMWGLPATPKSKCFKMLCGLAGRTLKADEELDLEAYKGNKYKVMISDSEKADDEGQLWQNVTVVKALNKKKRKKKKT